VYLLAMDASLAPRIEGCLVREEAFYTADCPFLEGGSGPCIFPEGLRPEVCITSFCRGGATVRQEIRRVRNAFRKLGRFVGFGRFFRRFLSRA
jgi:hypothetical protein